MSDSAYLIEIVARLRDEASPKIRDLQRAVDELRASAATGDVTGDLRAGLADTADEAERAAQAHRDLTSEQQKSRQAAQQSESDVKRVAQWQEDAAESTTGHAEATQELRRQQQLLPQDAARAEAATKRVSSAHDAATQSVADHAAAHVDLSGNTEEARQRVEQLASGVRNLDGAVDHAASSTSDLTEAQSRAASRGEALLGTVSRLDQAARTHTATNKQLEVAYGQVASGLRSVSREFDAGSSEARRFGDAMEQAATKAKNTDLARSSSTIGQLAQKFSQATDTIGIKVISLSAALRGLRLVGLVGLFQPIATGLLSLAGGFFNVASGAAQAGATIGGVFLSGLGQLIPMVSVGIAALIRLRDVFQAVQAAQQARQQSFFAPYQGLITHLQNVSQLIQSEQSLTNSYYTLQDAQVQVKESQIALTQARIDAIRNIQDLTIAERDAQLQLKQANLSQTQAEQQLQAARASGSQMAIREAELGVQAARIQTQRATLGVPRSRQDLALALRYGVSGSPQVLSATEAVRQSLLGVREAHQQVADAKRQLEITHLTLKEPASYMTQPQATLRYLLGQMSAPEKALYSVLDNLEKQLRSPNSPLKKLSDYIIEPFTYAFSRLDSLLHDASFVRPITELARTMGRGLQGIFSTMFGSRGTSFFETMARDATKSIPIVVRAITGLMKVFEDVAKAAAPAFNRLSGDWARFWNAMDRRDSTPQGQARLTAFFDKGARWAEDFAHLASAVFDLFKALGHDAAPQGMNTVTTLTEAIHDATTWVQTHGQEVTNFFSQAKQGLSLMGGVLFSIGKTLLQVFSLTSLRAFASFLQGVVLPAAQMFASAIGFVVTNVMRLLNAIGPLKDVIVGLVATGFGLAAVGRLITLVTKATNVVHGFVDAYRAFNSVEGILNRVGAAWDALTTRIGKGATATRDAKKAQQELATAAQTSAGEQEAASTEVDTALSGQLTLEDELIAQEQLAGTTALTSAGEEGLGAGALGLGTAGAEGASSFGIGTVALGAAPFAIPLGIFGLANALGLGGNATPASQLARRLAKARTGSPLEQIIAGLHQSPAQKSFGSTPTGRAVDTFFGAANSASQLPGGEAVSSLAGVQQYLGKFISEAHQTNLLTASSQDLSQLRQRAQELLQLPDITAPMRTSLQKLITSLNPVNIAIAKTGAQWAQTFAGFNVTTQNVMQQVQQQLSQDSQAISSNFITGTQGWTEQVIGLTSSAWNKVQSLAALGVRGTAAAMNQLDQMLQKALNALGVKSSIPVIAAQGVPMVNQTLSDLAAGKITSSQASIVVGPHAYTGPHAAGGWHSARPGGSLAQVGEGGHDEVTLTTDPRYATRQRALLGQYIQRAPFMAAGGHVGVPSVYQSPFGSDVVTWGRTDQGVDADLTPGAPIGVIGNARVTGVLAGWYNGQPLIYYQLLDGPDAGRYVYLAEQITGVRGLASTDPRATSSLRAEVGHTLSKGQRIAYYATSGTGIETGWATSSGETLARATTGYAEGQVTPAGSSFRSFLQGLSRGVITTGMAISQLVAPKVQGVGGVFGQIAQGVVNKVTAAANQYLVRQGGLQGAAMPSVSLSGPVEKQVYEFMTAAGFNRIAIAGILGNAMRESTMNPNAAGGGLWQQVSNFGSGTGGSLLNQMRTMLPQIIGFRGILNSAPSAAMAALAFSNLFEKDQGTQPGAGPYTPNTSPIGDVAAREAFAQSAYMAGYAGGGLLGRHLRRIGLRHLRRRVLRFAEGGMAPWGGAPVPIIAHEGERIVNPPQWNEIGRLTGMGAHGLDSHLGYDTGSPRQHFDAGGTVSSLSPRNVIDPLLLSQTVGTDAIIMSLSAALRLLQTIASNLFKTDPGSLAGGFTALSKVLSAMTDAITRINRLPLKDQTGKLTTLIEAFADPNNPDSTLNLLAAAFQRFQGNLTDWITSVGYSVGRVSDRSIGHRTRHGFVGTGFGGVRLRGSLTRRDIGRTGQAELDSLAVRASVEETSYLQREEEAARKAMSETRSRIERIQRSNLPDKVKDATISRLESGVTVLKQGIETLRNSIASQVQNTFQAEQQKVQDTVSQIGDIFQSQQERLQGRQSIAEMKGQFGRLPSINEAIIRSARGQVEALQAPLREAERMHDSDLVAQIKQQIDQLRQTIGQTSAQMIQDAISGIQQHAESQQAKVAMLQAVSQTMEQAASTPEQFAAAGAMSRRALMLNQSSLRGQLSSYNTLLAQAIETHNRAAVASITQTIDQLTGQLVQNEQAIKDNTAQVVNQTAQFVQARGQFQTGVFGGLAQVITTIGQTTGFTNVPALKNLYTQSNASLSNTNRGLLGQLAALGGGAGGLAALLGTASTPAQFVAALSGANLPGIEAGHTATWITAFEGIITSLESNTQALAQNNQQLATLNGQLLQPQQWSTTSWSAFRNAIFSGMGNLLPQYQALLPPGTAPTIAPTFTSVTPRGGAHIENLNINHAPTSSLSPSIIGEQMAYEVANAV